MVNLICPLRRLILSQSDRDRRIGKIVLARSSKVAIPLTDSLGQAVHLHNNFFGTR